MGLYELAWGQASQAPPSETRQQRARLKTLKDILGSPGWREEERRLAAERHDPQPVSTPRPRVSRPRPVAPSVPAADPVVRSSNDAAEKPGPRPAGVAPVPAVSRRPRRAAGPALLELGRLWELATDLRPLLEQTARAGATIGWPAIRKRLPGLPVLQRDDECLLLWLVDEDRQTGEPLLSALVTAGDRQMHPRFPEVAEELGLPAGRTPGEQHATWGYEVLKTHQHRRHR
ncbi:hypothetical protein [Streptomyces violascens]|uniref:hypothetical protein n=1 Tax=Streptomyces violascens TaxID=67381 RepID=UPI001671B6EF|nr:hypothetical protein [Streptomyces violascens]GGU41371.1 hypothetical protein GCM10010289_72860 [Streptomyces violascens]